MNSINTFVGHTNLVYGVSWSPHLPNCFASVSGYINLVFLLAY